MTVKQFLEYLGTMIENNPKIGFGTEIVMDNLLKVDNIIHDEKNNAIVLSNDTKEVCQHCNASVHLVEGKVLERHTIGLAGNNICSGSGRKPFSL